MRTFASLLVATALATSAFAHSIFQVSPDGIWSWVYPRWCGVRPVARMLTRFRRPQELHVNGVSQGHMVGIRVPDYDGVSVYFQLGLCSSKG